MSERTRRTSRGYTQPLYLLPFDHRHSYETDMFGLAPPLTPEQRHGIAESKQLIYEGFRQALGPGVPPGWAGILVDEEFGAEILRDANERGYVTALATERSGTPELELEYGAGFAQHIEAFGPTFAKVLVRYNVEDEAAGNDRQRLVLKRLSDYCRTAGPMFMVELLVPATKEQLESVKGETAAYDLHLRPGLMCRAIRSFQGDGIEPDVWKVEGLDRREDCERVVEAARRGDRPDVGCIVLGRGADENKVRAWLEVAASVPGFIGFAVGRTTFWEAVTDYLANKTTRDEATSRIAQRYLAWTGIFQRAQLAVDPGHHRAVAHGRIAAKRNRRRPGGS
jgi:myo-inositol catabolism protein IolC